MSSIFGGTNLQQNTAYQSLDFSGKGFIKARYSLVGATIQCFIKLVSGGNSVSIGSFSNTVSRLDIPVAYQQDKVRLEFISDKNLSFLQVDFEAQYSYQFGSGTRQQENGGISNSSFNCGYYSSGNNLATGNQAQQILSELGNIESLVSNLPVVNYSTELAALLTVLNSLISSVNTLPTQTYTTQLNGLQTAVDAIPVIDYNNRFNSVDTAIQAIRDKQNQGASINVPDYSSQLNSIQTRVNLLPSYSSQNDTANISTKVDDLAILVGGKASSSQANNIYSDTQAIKNTELPKLATGNQANNIQSSINSLNSSVANIPRNNYQAQLDRVEATGNSARTESQNIPRATYNSQLNAIQATANNANAGVTTLSSSQSTRFNSVDSSLSGISTQIASLSGSNGSAASVVSLNVSALVAPYVANNPERDLIYLLGAIATGYLAVGGVAVGVTANSVESGDPASIFGKVIGSGWYSTNASGRFFTIDLGLNKTTRNIVLTGLGMQSYDFGGGFPVTLAISGSNNNSTYTSINTWSSIGFTADQQWKYTTFSNSVAYRYLRITQSGLTSTGSNYLGFRELRLYGTINNP